MGKVEARDQTKFERVKHVMYWETNEDPLII